MLCCSAIHAAPVYNVTRFQTVLAGITKLEASMLAAIGLLGGLLWAFLSIADAVSEGDTKTWDTRILLLLRDPSNSALPWGPQWVQEMARDLTALGSVTVLTLLTAAVIGYLVLVRKRHAALGVFIAITSGQILSTLLKAGFDRARPDIVPHGTVVYTASFPSGHSMMAAITYLTLGALLARVHGPRRTKVYLLTVALVLTGLVGISRVYLGVHWPTDVLAGWAVGATWALLCAMVVRVLQKYGQVEPPSRAVEDPPWTI